MLAKDYAKVYRANSILTAPPGQLVLLLFDAALAAMDAACRACELPPKDLSRFELVHRHTTKARRIIAELKGSLKFEVGGDFARNMDKLYDYYSRRLFEANLRKDPAPIREVEGLLRQVRDAWEQMLRGEGADGVGADLPDYAVAVGQ
jgi:flagellar protein FliS